MAATFHLDILAASVPFYRGDCVSLVIPTEDGEIGVLAGHCRSVGAVSAGELGFETAEGEQRRAAVAPGIFKIDGQRVLLLVDAAERPEDIDTAGEDHIYDETRYFLMSRPIAPRPRTPSDE